jgi:hypothetical protein
MGIKAELLKAIYARLNGASLGATGVYSVKPDVADGGDSSVFPYVKIGVIVLTQADTQTTNGENASIRIHTYDRADSMLPASEIQDAIYAVLHRVPLSVTGYANYLMLRNDTDLTDGADSKIHGVCEYRALIESA